MRQGRTDAWIAHQLEVTVQQITTFKQEYELTAEAEAGSDGQQPSTEEQDLRASDDALIAAELDAEAARRAEEEAAEAARRAEEEAAAAEAGETVADEAADSEDDGGTERKGRRRGRRGGRSRGRKSTQTSFEGTFDHGEEGYGLWLDPAIADNGVYAEHWAGKRDVTVTFEADQIIIRRAGETGEE